MFVLVWSISAAIGTIVVIETSIITLLWAIILTPLTFCLALLFGVLSGLGEAIGSKKNDSNHMEETNELAWMPLRWAGRVIGIIWERLGRFLSRESSKSGSRTDVDAVRGTVSGRNVPRGITHPNRWPPRAELTYEEASKAEAERRAAKAQRKQDESSANIMVEITVALTFLAIILQVWRK
jgi:hypothetical protein